MGVGYGSNKSGLKFVLDIIDLKAFLRHINRKHKFKCYQFWAADFLARLLYNVEFSFSDMLLYDITSH